MYSSVLDELMMLTNQTETKLFQSVLGINGLIEVNVQEAVTHYY